MRVKKKLKEELKWLKDNGIPLDTWVKIPDDLYHNGIGLSASGLKTLAVSPAHLKYANDTRGN